MSTIKVDTLQTRAGSTAAVTGAGFVATDQIRGNTAANSVTVVAEGGTNTTNLQQGLAKQWLNWDGATTIADSFNTTSATDNASGDTTITIANDMASINFAVSALSKSNDNGGVRMATMQFPANQTAIAAGTYRMHCQYDNTTLRDAEMQTASVLGDLA